MDDVSRPGDNLYTVSLIALDAETGKLRWHYQQVPHDLWGYDVASPPILFDLALNGEKTPAIGQAAKTGWFYVHERTTGKLIHKSEPFVPQHNLFRRPNAEGVRIHPGAVGGANWSPSAFDPIANLAFVAGVHMPMRYTVHEKPAENGKPALRYSALEPIEEPRWGVLSAIDQHGTIKWQHKTAQPLIGGVLAAGGGLVFTGEGNGRFDAFDSATGKLLWHYQTDGGVGVNAPPITYAIDGVQYVAVAASGNSLFGYKQGDSLLVFALPR